ncbi:MAG: protein kinase [Alphaproteobacteria bacterium]|nr:protein kinase [Alphaproteobacteria bacterium]
MERGSSPAPSGIRALLDPAGQLDAEAREAFDREGAETNRSRLRAILPVMLLAHLGHVWGFWPTEGLDPAIAYWREAIAWTHGLTIVAVLGLTIAAFTVPLRSMRWLAPLALLVYLLHGAVVAGVDQLNTPTVTPYMAYCIVIAMLLVLEPVPGAVAYLIGLAAYFAALLQFQPDIEVRRTFMPNGPSITIASIAMVVFLYRARLRDFLQRRTIDAQQRQLESWNADLEARVDAQVHEIKAHAEEVGRLNAQLQAQVRDRSRELARALERLAEGADSTPSFHGRVLGGRFELLSRIGIGGMGAVYEGLDQATGQRVAIKVIRADLGAPVHLLRRFLREAETVASLDHPAIVRMLHVDIDDDGTFFQVQELVDGEPLSKILERHGKLAPDVTCRLLATLAGALAEAHAHGIVHRDVKPGNILLTPTAPGLKLLDFGVAKLRQALEESRRTRELQTAFDTLPPDEPLTRTGMMIGTPGYMAPEQLAGPHETTERSDVYPLGVLGWYALTGAHPFRGPRDAVPNLAAEAPHAPAELLAWIRRCLVMDVEVRPSAAEVAEGLGALADSLDAPALETLVKLDTLRSGTTDAEETVTPD